MIDFGDSVVSHRVNDCAVGMAYAMVTRAGLVLEEQQKKAKAEGR